ncbi:hypothetical protein H696_02079 [Fonticula alba]|uniref:Ethanolaminephosphotransferase n=1 Tax=Fonticula alba TaxID=691883 RepID=A0A058ZB31_FONAL|nr:hypothetical protein H696_02079 [Fonticula alba]KCV71128.1 hypothetical protein H696_02079 [Fonticula alba]|eukprot:XP_009494251.1 hypothetical protein H696_02079 [Fonticula alba]
MRLLPQGMLDLGIHPEALKGLDSYKYGAVDKSPVTKYVMKPYWDWAATLFPMWMAPNLITLLGFSAIIVSLLLTFLLFPDLEENSAFQWVYFFFAAALHLYQTLDNVDGRQARRTGSSSPLGELFDHGVDALNCSFGAIVQAAAMGLGFTWRTVALLLLTVGPFYLSTWEEYHTGVLYLGYINGPTEGNIMATLLIALSGVFGTAIWTLPISQFLPGGWWDSKNAIGQFWAGVSNAFEYGDPEAGPAFTDVMFLFLFTLIIVIQLPLSVSNIRRHYAAKGRSSAGALLGIIPMLVYFVLVFSIAFANDQRIIVNNAVSFVLMAGIAFGRHASKITQAYVTRQPFPWATVQYIPLLVLFVNTFSMQLFGLEPFWDATTESQMIVLFAVLHVLLYVYSAVRVVNAFCGYLGIQALRIRPKND